MLAAEAAASKLRMTGKLLYLVELARIDVATYAECEGNEGLAFSGSVLDVVVDNGELRHGTHNVDGGEDFSALVKQVLDSDLQFLRISGLQCDLLQLVQQQDVSKI